MTLQADMAASIAMNGPMTVADYMAQALMHPTLGYYSTRDPFGAKGDFITAPEISQMFGEVIGLCLAQAWIDQGRPTPFTLAELGPGRGTLMADILRAGAKADGFTQAADIHLIETSPALRAEQAKRVTATWHDTITTLPDQPLFLVANEFFDALPIRQFQRAPDGWSEIRVTTSGTDALAPCLSPPAQYDFLTHRLEDTKPDDIVEHCPALPTLISQIANRIAPLGGMALLIDYGDWRSLGSTLQALKNHEPVDPFDAPGTADLTAHVDFEAIALAADPAKYTRVTPQGMFLERLGITQRAQTLASSLSGDALDQHIAAHRRLTHPEEMGSLFKVMGLYPPSAPPPAGLEP